LWGHKTWKLEQIAGVSILWKAVKKAGGPQSGVGRSWLAVSKSREKKRR